MRLALYRHLWGVRDPVEVALPRFKARGYEGIEAAVPAPEDRARFREVLDEHGLAYAAGVATRGSSAAEHLASFRAQVEDARALGAGFVVCHAGRDGWPEAEADRFFTEALEVERDLGLPVGFETHRGRVTYSPWTTARLLERFPDLKLTCDFSHWVVVCERLLDGEEEAIVRECAERALHLHARVGHEQGPQVSDPTAPEWAPHLDAHERWWRLVWEAQARRGVEVSTLTPEFGPPNYLPTLPHTRAPVVDLEAACDWMAERQAAVFRSSRL